MKLRWRECLLAFFMAVALWYGVSGSEKVESQVDARVDYRGLPQGLVVRSGQVNKVSVRLRASMGMLRSIAAKEYAFFMDLSGVRKGENELAIHLSALPFRTGVEVMEVTPSRIFLDVDTIESKTVPLAADISGKLPADVVAHVGFTPAEVTITGASSRIERMNTIRVSVPVEADAPMGVTESLRLLPLPDGVDASPAEVKQNLHIGLKRKLTKVTRVVQVDAPGALGKYIRPDKVTISVAVPESQVGKVASHPEIRAFARLERFELGTYALPVQVRIPEGSEFVGVDPPRITVTLEQKKPPAKKR